VRTAPVRRPRKKTAAEPFEPAKAGDVPPHRSERDALEFRALQDFRTVVGSARQYDAEVRRITGISGSQLWALSEISRAGGMRVNTLAERLALHQTTASNLVNALAERRLVRRTRDEADQRVVRLFATAEGMRLLLRAPQPYTGLLVEALRKLDPADLHSLTRGLTAMLGAMRRPATSTAGETLLGE
jgi:MarR family transcriptional regulator, organic hydroperoxide resistance regulator